MSSSALTTTTLDFKSSGSTVARLSASSSIFTLVGAGGSGTVELKGISTPTQDNSVATKAYVDSISAGHYWKDSVVAASTSSVTLSSAVQNGSTLDGVTLATGDRILLKDQSSAADNGIYIVAASGAPSRATDLASGASAGGASIFVTSGTTNNDSGWVCTNTKGSSDVVATDDLTFVQFSGLGQVTAGAGLTKSGNTLDVGVDDSTIEISSDALRVKDSGITNAKLANSSVTVTAGDGLGSGGSVALGSSVTLAVDSTVVRTTGAQSIAGVKTFSDTTDSTASTNGAVVVSGGVGVALDITAGGDVNATAFNATSDARLKKDVEGISMEQADDLLKLNPVAFNWLDESKEGREFGFLAQEMQEVFPNLVGESNGHLNVNYLGLIAVLVKKVQMLEAKLSAQ